MYGLSTKTYSDYFKSIDQLDAWRHILGAFIDPYDKITSPFRADTHANCYIREYQGLLLFTDHAYKIYNGYNCVKAWAFVYNVDYYTAVQMIYDHQFHQALPAIQRSVTASGEKMTRSFGSANIQFEPYLFGSEPTFTEIDKHYWSKRGVSTRQLQDPTQPVYSVHHYYVNGRLYYPLTYPCYAYHFPETNHTKLYCPNNPKDDKFPASTATSEDIWKWLDPTNETALVTKSYKDGRLISNFGLDIDVYAPQSEGTMPEKLIKSLSYYKNVVILYDNDNPGKQAAAALQQAVPNSVTLFYPSEIDGKCIKDTDDMVVNRFSSQAKELIYGTIDRSHAGHSSIHANSGLPH